MHAPLDIIINYTKEILLFQLYDSSFIPKDRLTGGCTEAVCSAVQEGIEGNKISS